MFKKKFDYNDPQNFLPDNKTIGTAQYYQKKIPNLPDYMYPIMEAKARVEYSEEDKNKFCGLMFQLKREQDEKLLQEYDDRVHEAAIEKLNENIEKNNLDMKTYDNLLISKNNNLDNNNE